MLRSSSLACRLVPSGLRTFSKGWGLLSRGSAAYGTLLDTGGAAALWEKSHGRRRVLDRQKRGWTCSPNGGKRTRQIACMGAAQRGRRR